ncbi:PREDICTED: solute carrier family 25 member 40-like isoform X2 [Nicrophorus vespilloides]|uniref:Solute carrier family 25 member 40-like isoform X2 n=1 Tax=Nicrophorus vespilloides TaxID=110193 RepID=A0ABM1N9T8_NICVS|nr:PREDICTED: solute carrier family 25 member 40-like isoform X2 [Nicrophorus vespilloides]
MTRGASVPDIDDPKYRITPMQQVLASCTGAIATSIFVTPLDVVKIRLQAQRKNVSKCFLYCNGLMDHLCDCSENSKWIEKPSHFNGTLDAFMKISRYEGVTSLWSGLSPTLVLAVPATIIYFVTYEQLRLKLKDNYNRNRPTHLPKTQPMWIPLMAGGTARIFSVTIVSPLELIRTKMQFSRQSYFEIGEALQVLIKNNGVFGLWKGVFATLLRDVPFSALYWSSYETIKNYFNPTTPSFGFSFFAGAVSGSIAATVTVPFDVVKTHQQIEIGNKVFSNQAPQHDSTMSIIRKLYTNFGVSGLFTGLVPRLIKVAPACAVMIATFEHSKVAFNRNINIKG